ncbi:MAG: hypothetical protein B0A82_14470 [Alkalinema sp. CACIAM 70d]|nr:MAG: hypothetical protein B0A82_14470 [Alkalinema sp. CACIAM 70d]
MIGQLLADRFQVTQIYEAGNGFLASDTHRPGYPCCVIQKLPMPTGNPQAFQIAKLILEQRLEAIARLGKYPHLPGLLTFFEQDQQIYLAEECVAGHPLSQELQQPLPEPQVIHLMLELLDILVFLHRHEVILRGLYPDNLLRRQSDGKLVLINLLVLPLKDPASTHTPARPDPKPYLPPEQLAGNPLFSSNLYSVGMIAIQALTGLTPEELLLIKPQWQGKTTVSRDLAEVIDRLTCVNPKQRYPSAMIARRILKNLLMDEDPTTDLPPPCSPQRRSPVPPSTLNSTHSNSLEVNYLPRQDSDSIEGHSEGHSEGYAAVQPVGAVASPQAQRNGARNGTMTQSPDSLQSSLLRQGRPQRHHPLEHLREAAVETNTPASQTTANLPTDGVDVADMPAGAIVGFEPTALQLDVNPAARLTVPESARPEVTPLQPIPTIAPAAPAPQATSHQGSRQPPGEPPVSQPVSAPAPPHRSWLSWGMMGWIVAGCFGLTTAWLGWRYQVPQGWLAGYFHQAGLNQSLQGNYRAALQSFDRSIAWNGSDAQTYYDRGVAFYRLKDLRRALEDFTRAIQLNGKDARAFFQRGNIRLSLGDPQGAVGDYNQAIQLNGELPEAYVQRGQAQSALGKSGLALKDYSNAIRLEPNLAAAYINRCLTRSNLADQAGAISDCTQAASIDPNLISAYQNRGLSYHRTGNLQQAMADLNVAIKLDGEDAKSYYQRGLLRMDLDDRAGAIADFNTAIQFRPDHAFAYYQRALVRSQLDDQEGAIQDLERAAKYCVDQGMTGCYRDAQYQLKRLKNATE